MNADWYVAVVQEHRIGVELSASGVLEQEPLRAHHSFAPVAADGEPAVPVVRDRAEIEQLAELVGRNKHQTTLLALRRGIEVLRREAEQLGNNAELLR